MLKEKRKMCTEIAEIYERIGENLMKKYENSIDEYPFLIEAAEIKDKLFAEAINCFENAKKYRKLSMTKIGLILTSKEKLEKELTNLKK